MKDFKDLHLKDLNVNIDLGKAKEKLTILKEFQEFAMRGNVVDLAVGVVVGSAFTKIVTSLVGDILTPFLGLLTPEGMDFKEKFISLQPSKTLGDKTLAAAKAHGAVIAYGQFLSNVVDFIIVAFCIFLMVKLINKLRRAPAPPPPEPAPQEKLLMEIRDLLKQKG